MSAVRVAHLSEQVSGKRIECRCDKGMDHTAWSESALALITPELVKLHVTFSIHAASAPLTQGTLARWRIVIHELKSRGVL